MGKKKRKPGLIPNETQKEKMQITRDNAVKNLAAHDRKNNQWILRK